MIHRRNFLKLSGLSAASLAIAACGVQGQGARQPASTADAAAEIEKFWKGKRQSGEMVFANWPEYMPEDKAVLKAFTKKHGIKVDYKEVIQENASFFGKIQPQLAAGQSIGYDIIVMTDGIEMTKMLKLGYLIPLDHDRLPDFAANADEIYKNPSYDPGNRYTVPYASGVTGIAVNTKHVDEDITRIEQLWDPKYKGKVGMMADAQELGNFGMFLVGADPEKSTPTDWDKAARKLREQREAGIVRKYYEQDYVDDVVKGNVWLTMAWSGDVFQRIQEGAPLKFVIPEEGGTIWTDNMCIPKGAANPVDAIMLMDWLFDVERAAELAEWIQYIPPVGAAKDVIERWAAEAKGEDRAELEAVAKSPLVFPTEADYAKLRHYRSLDTNEMDEYEKRFQPIAQGG